jgi:iron complex outermembrane receptor protein
MSSLVSQIIIFIFSLCSVIEITAAPIKIPLITVKSAKKAHKTGQSSGEQFGASEQDVKHRGVVVTSDFFQQQGVVQMASHSSQQGQSSISMHGFGANSSQNNLVLLDGIPFNSFTTIGPNIDGILVQAIHQINVLPGSHGSLYGDGAIGGVVDIKTAIASTPVTDISAGAGNLSQGYSSIFFSRHPSQQLGYSFGGSFYQNAHTQPRDKQQNYNVNAAVSYTGQCDRLDAFFIGFKNNAQIPTGIPWGQSSADASGHYFSNILGQLAFIKNQWFITPSWRWVSALSTQNARSSGAIMSPFVSRQHEVLWQNALHYKKLNVSGLNVEAQSYHQNMSTRVDDVSAWSGDVFTHWNIPVTQYAHVVLGARGAHQSVDANPASTGVVDTHSNVFVSEQGVLFDLPRHWHYYLRRDGNYRFAKANEKVWTEDNARNLKTQMGTSYETGLKWAYAHNQFVLGAYWLNLNNEIAYDPSDTSVSPFGQMFNLPPTRRLGVDLAMHTVVTQSLSMDAQAGYVDGRFISGVHADKRIPTVSAFNVSLAATYAHQSQWFITLNEQYHSWFYAFEDLDNVGPKMPGYFLTNVALQKRWKKLDFNLSLNNLLDKHYVRFANHFEVPFSSTEYFPGDGFNFLFKLTVHLS